VEGGLLSELTGGDDSVIVPIDTIDDFLGTG
jgi:hypothetical protein